MVFPPRHEKWNVSFSGTVQWYFNNVVQGSFLLAVSLFSIFMCLCEILGVMFSFLFHWCKAQYLFAVTLRFISKFYGNIIKRIKQIKRINSLKYQWNFLTNLETIPYLVYREKSETFLTLFQPIYYVSYGQLAALKSFCLHKD